MPQIDPIPEPEVPARDYEAFLASKRAPAPPDPVPAFAFPSQFFDWQAVVTRWALRRGRAAMYEECGLGKTIQELAWGRSVVEHTNRPVLLFAPLGASLQTAAEAVKFDFDATRIREPSEVTGPRIYITNYERSAKFDLSMLGGVIADESSIFKDVSGVTRRLLTAACASVRYRLSCTATPCPNDVVELGNQAEFLGVMTRAAMLATFFINDAKLEASQGKWRLKKHAEKAFYDWLATWCVYIRSPEDLGYDGSAYQLPEHREELILVEHDFRFAGLFKTPARSLSELRQVRKSSIRERLDALIGVGNGEGPRLTWCGLNDEAAAICEAFPNAIEVKGADSSDYKEETLMAFARGEISHLVTKSKIAGHGMNWQVCNQQDFFGLDHSFEGYFQSYRRVWRYGQKRSVHTRILLSDVASHVWETVVRKREESERMGQELANRMRSSMEQSVKSKPVAIAIEPSPSRVVRGANWESHHADSVELIRKVDADSIGYQMMSPPFPDVYAYSSSERDMGNGDWKTFWGQMDFLIPEMLRVAIPGRLCTMHCMDIPIMKGKEGYIGLRDFPGEIVRRFVEAGWIYFARRMIWKDPVVENARTHSLGHGNLLKDSTGSRAGLPDYLVTFLKPGDNPLPVEHTRESFPVVQWQKWADPAWTGVEYTGEESAESQKPPDWMLAPVWYDIRQSDTLQRTSARDHKDEKHIAPLQLTVIKRCLTMWSTPGDLVASWFGGIGSEGFMAVKMGRRALLCELKKSYWEQNCRNMRTAEKFKDQQLLPGMENQGIGSRGNPNPPPA